MLKIYDAENIIDAQLALDELRAGGLDAFIKGEHLVGGAGELPLTGTISVWISVAQHEQRARDLIRDFETDRKKEHPQRYCGSCRELIDGNFGRCWNCSAMLD